jgi:phenylpyruvate tautomerase PptA (4-oxalocrotonate tautomerase family)
VAQVKIFGLRSHLDPIKKQLSDLIHTCVMEALHYPADKRSHRFFPLAEDDFFYPPDRTQQYTILEISMFEGRSVEAKKHLMRLLFSRCQERFGISPQDLEVTFFETPKSNWGFRGLPGDEHTLDYKVEV